jgi:uncharacterized protein (TIGR03083 family)
MLSAWNLREVSVPLPREEITAGLFTEYERVGELLRSLTADELQRPTRCTGWTVGDVGAHVIGTMADITAGKFEGLGTPEVTQREVEERKGRSGAELADEMEQVIKLGTDILAMFDDESWNGPAPGGLGVTVAEGTEALWYDAYLHGEDIRAALGQSPTTSPGLRASVSHITDILTRDGWGPAIVAVDGMEEFPVSGGGGQRITGDPLDFVLVATGRKDAAVLGLDETVNIYREQ